MSFMKNRAAQPRMLETPKTGLEGLRLQCGENWWGTLDLRHAIEAQASDLFMPDVMKIGGLTGWLRAAAIAHAQGLRISNHLWPEISARLLCCTPTAHWLEYADWCPPQLHPSL